MLKELIYLKGENKTEITAMHIAQELINKSKPNTNESITHLKLQKLLYYAQGWNLGIHGELMFTDDIHAWVNGPVVPTIYNRFKRYEYFEIGKINCFWDEKTNKPFVDHEFKRIYCSKELWCHMIKSEIENKSEERIFHFCKKQSGEEKSEEVKRELKKYQDYNFYPEGREII
ncbi:Panacea domain-containing protein [Bacillus paranthracis]|uniref:Panacea domain-containing protein n=1 Tax=Bacillus paranthracis TaxID=2026186 RepID=UPI002FDC39A2